MSNSYTFLQWKTYWLSNDEIIASLVNVVVQSNEVSDSQLPVGEKVVASGLSSCFIDRTSWGVRCCSTCGYVGLLILSKPKYYIQRKHTS